MTKRRSPFDGPTGTAFGAPAGARREPSDALETLQAGPVATPVHCARSLRRFDRTDGSARSGAERHRPVAHGTVPCTRIYGDDVSVDPGGSDHRPLQPAACGVVARPGRGRNGTARVEARASPVGTPMRSPATSRAGARKPTDGRADGLTATCPGYAECSGRAVAGQPRLYVSAESHLAWFKIAHQAGIGREAVRLVPTAHGNPRALEKLVEDRGDGDVPVFIGEPRARPMPE